MKLSNCQNNTQYTVKEVIECDFDCKLMEYGIIPGANVLVLNKAPFNGPLYLSIGTQRIAIRKEEASYIVLE
ncbi:ferrous iron transport protein A [Flavobacteriales bacterium]|nr:ferrous iron transport protein A [Flavobacteriales bacterium]MDC1370733.1 ferrous iron transport protein A [Flavobacteriales bacterium]